MIKKMRSSLLSLLVLTVCTGTIVSSSGAAPLSAAATVPRRLFSLSRTLEDNEEDNDNNDMNDYNILQGTCFRVKIDDNNDDDGNSYFYNGSYRSQYQRYISYNLCDSNANDACNQYVLDLETFLEGATEFVQQYCNSCQNTCRRRRLEDAEDEEGDGDYWAVDCDACQNECKELNNNNNNNDNKDESQYLDCQQAAAGDDDNDDALEYYTAPQCENGAVVIGHFYDDECTIKTSTLQDDGYSYATFNTISKLGVICQYDGESCEDLLDGSVLCTDNADLGDDDSKICKAAASADRVYTFYKKPFYKKVPIGFIFGLFFLFGAMFGFLSYTYYVRHRRSQNILLGSNNEDSTKDLPNMS